MTRKHLESTTIPRRRPRAATAERLGAAAGGSAQKISVTGSEARSTDTSIVKLGSPAGPSLDLTLSGGLAGGLGESSEVLLVTRRPNECDVPAAFPGLWPPPNPPKFPNPDPEYHMHSISSDARGVEFHSSMCDFTPMPVRVVGKGKPGEESRSETTASDSDNPIHFRLHGMASAGAGGMLHPSMCDWSPELYETKIIWNQSLDSHPSGSGDPSSSSLANGVHIDQPPSTKSDLIDMHAGSPETPQTESHLLVDSSQEPKSSLVIGGPGVESRGETPRTASGGTYTSQPKLGSSCLYQQKVS